MSPKHPFGTPPSFGASARLTPPLPGATLRQAVSRFFHKYSTFSGRASRSEYWRAQLALAIVAVLPAGLVTASTIISAIDASGDFATFGYGDSSSVTPRMFDDQLEVGLLMWGMFLFFALGVVTIIPLLAITWRRLHDANLAGPFFFLAFIPVVGSLILLVLLLQGSKPEGARFDAYAA